MRITVNCGGVCVLVAASWRSVLRRASRRERSPRSPPTRRTRLSPPGSPSRRATASSLPSFWRTAAAGSKGIPRIGRSGAAWRRHAALLNENGYVTLILDSFGPRRITDGCQTGGKYYSLQVNDAHAALDHLASLPFVDSDRIGLVGLSLGGGTALRLALRGYTHHRTASGQETYAALVAYYPWCEAAWAFSLDRPVLILIGADDNWTPAPRCIALDSLAGKTINRPVLELKVYPNAHHSFDLPMQGPYYVEGMPGVYPHGAGERQCTAGLAGANAGLLRDRHLGPVAR